MDECPACGYPQLRPDGHAAFCASVLAAARLPGCSVDGCDRLHYGLGMCYPHYKRAYRARLRSAAG